MNSTIDLAQNEVSIRRIDSLDELKSVHDFASQHLAIDTADRHAFSHYTTHFARTPELFLVAQQGAAIQGGLLGVIQDDHVLVEALVVAPSARTSGIGSRLLDEIEVQAKRLDQTRIMLGAKETAEEFYLKCNYAPKLFVQILRGNALSELLRAVDGYPIIWQDEGESAAKVIVETATIKKDLQKRLEDELADCYTQYLFFKDI